MVSNTAGIYPVVGLRAYGELQRKAEQNLKYANGIQFDTKQSLGDIAKDSILYGGLTSAAFTGVPWLYRNKGNLRSAITEIKNLPVNKPNLTFDSLTRQVNDGMARKLMLDAEKFGQGGKKIVDLAKESINTADKALRAERLAQAKKEYEDIIKLAKAQKNPGRLTRMASYTGSKISSIIPENTKNFYSGIKTAFKNKIATPAAVFISKHPTLAKGAEFFKGKGAIFAGVVDGLLETFTEVIPAFKLGGLTGGIKQIFKSGVKVAATVAGWVAGEAAGTSAGMAIGAAVGSVIPVVGTAIGAFIGGACGLIGGFFAASAASEIAKNIVGKSVREQMAEEQIQEQAKQIASDNMMRMQLNMLVNQKLLAQLQTGEITEEEYRKKQLELFMY